jgi:uncharacterized protein YkwD
MIKKITLTFVLLVLLTSCAKAPIATQTSTPVVLATATLPVVPTQAPPLASPTANASNETPACKDGAILVQDVTYPDNTHVGSGEKFTKTWQLQNTGDCKWTGYTVAFVSGDRLDAPDSVPVPETAPKALVNVSVELVAPSEDGPYTSNFELRNAQGKSVPVGTEPTFWVKIVSGAGGDPLGVEQRIGNCQYTEKPELVQAMIDLVNKTRSENGRKALHVNDKLMTAAQAHSLDMACNNTKFLLHSGSDGSYTGERLTKVGYTNPYYFELLGVGLPQDAMTEWRRHEDTWPAVLDVYVTDIGVGYVYSKASRFGGYWTVVLGAAE